jgi:hypothetical protein
MVYSFARVGAGLGMTVEDFYTQNRRLWVRCARRAASAMLWTSRNIQPPISTARACAAIPKGFRATDRGTGKLTRTMLARANAYVMIHRRAAAATIATRLGNHSFSRLRPECLQLVSRFVRPEQE